MSADFEDWTRGLELVVDDMSDFPDWTVAAQVTGGGSGGYASLTGAGQTVTPGELDQAGTFKVTAGDATFGVGVASPPFTDAIEMGTSGPVNITAGGIDVATNVGTFTTGIAGWSFTTDPGFDFQTDSLISTGAARIDYGISGAGATSGEGILLRDVGVTNTSVYIMVHHGNPNGAITPATGIAGFCIDTATPKLWAWAQGASSWVGV